MTEKSYTYNELRRLAKGSDGNDVRIAVLGDCSTQHLSTAICGSCKALGIDAAMLDTEFDQVRAMIDDPCSELYAFAPDHAVIYLCAEKLAERFCAEPPEKERLTFAERTAAETAALWQRFSSLRPGARIIHLGPAMPYDGVTGSLGNTTPSSFSYQLRRLSLLLCEAGAALGCVTYLDLEALQGQVGRDSFYDPRMYYIAQMTVSDAALPLLGGAIADIVAACSGRALKCVILDLDGTLWGGVLAEDGIGGLELGELGEGRAFSALQLYLRELRRRGILLAVCSKNDENAAREAIRTHPDMILREEDFAAFRANYEDKAANILSIAAELGIGTDSMVFLDDTPFERRLVRELVPEITVPELPDDPAMRPDMLKKLSLFEPSSLSSEDARRTEMYRAEAQRREEARSAATYNEYLASLDMRLHIEGITELNCRRVSQLSQRSNQFNLRTVRYTPEQIAALGRDSDALTLCFSLSDKHGDCGLVGIIVARHEHGGILFLETLLMSCRVLRRGVEACMMNALFDRARKLGCTAVRAEYIPTPKNGMVAELLPDFGFTVQDNTVRNGCRESITPGSKDSTVQNDRADNITHDTSADGAKGTHIPAPERRAYTCSCRVCDYIPKKTYIEVE